MGHLWELLQKTSDSDVSLGPGCRFNSYSDYFAVDNLCRICASLNFSLWEVVNTMLGGGFKHFLFSPLFGEMVQFD